MRQEVPRATPPAPRRASGGAKGGDKLSGGDKGSDANQTFVPTPVSVLGSLPSPFGSCSSSGPPSSSEAPGNINRMTTRRQSRLSAAAASASAAIDAAAAMSAPSSAGANCEFAPLATGLNNLGNLTRIYSSHSWGDKVTAASSTLLDPSPSLLLPETFSFSRAFDFERVIGRSELSEVWLARHRASGKLFAVKKSLASTSTAAASAAPPLQASSRRTANEVRVISSVPPHENLVQTVRSWREAGVGGTAGAAGTGCGGGGSFIQMEYCRGGSLAEAVTRAVRRSRRRARRERSGSGGGDGGNGEDDGLGAPRRVPSPRALPESAVWRVLLHVSRALEALHSSRVIHLDVKPENIYLSWEDRRPSSSSAAEDEEQGSRKEHGGSSAASIPDVVLKLGDFGLSVPANDPPDGGKLRWEEGDGRYCAPELLLLPSSTSASTASPRSSSPRAVPGSGVSSSRPTEAADVFSLGATLFECATGSPPPRGPPLSCEEISSAVSAAMCPEAADSGPGRRPGTTTTTGVLSELVASAMRPDPLSRPSAAQLARAAAEGERRCLEETRDDGRDEAGRRRRETADEALAAGLPLPPCDAEENGDDPLRSADPASLALLRRDARRRGYTLDGSMSLSIEADDDGGGEDTSAGDEKRGGTRRRSGGADEDDSDDGDSDDSEDDEEERDALLSRPPSAPRAGHVRRRTPRSAPQSPSGPTDAPRLLRDPTALPRFLPLAAAPAAPRPPCLSLERALSSMSIDGTGGAAPTPSGADAAVAAPLPPLPPQPLPSSFAPRRFGFGIHQQRRRSEGTSDLYSSDDLDPSTGDDEVGSRSDDDDLAETVRQLSMSASGQLALAPSEPKPPTQRRGRGGQ